MNYLGAHVSSSGGLYNAPLNAKAIGANAFAMFTKNQKQWSAKPLTAEEIAQLKATDHAAHQDLLNRLQVEAEETMAKNPPRPFNEVQKQTYSKIGGAPHLDGEYTVFGEVVDGMPIALRIGRTPVDARERPRKAVSIKRIRIN